MFVDHFSNRLELCNVSGPCLYWGDPLNIGRNPEKVIYGGLQAYNN
jgi:hypothetical protein